MDAPPLSKKMRMKDILAAFPSAQRTLYQKFHVGGCMSCCYQETDTLEELCHRRGIDVEEALRQMNTRADERVIETFSRQPIYYKCNRFAVVGPDHDIVWPS
ncbi:MAG TPA: hypothetical protein P5079_11265, partial [Elusimicrobiota bacterium]|nr:hypothetical protein [Elusimicrobiota bacterium]